MILKNQSITDLKIEGVKDLYKLKPFFGEGALKINKSQIARVAAPIGKQTVELPPLRGFARFLVREKELVYRHI